MAGDVHIDEVERAIGLTLPTGDYETVSGLVLQTLGRLPEAGEQIDLELQPTAAQLTLDEDAAARHVRIEVLAVERHVPARVRITLPEAPGDGDGEDA